MFLLWMIPAVLSVSNGVAREPVKPACNQRTYGLLWPPPEAHRPGTALEMCSLNVWKYHWETVTVPYPDAKKRRRP